jgi:hypothetical protein
MVSATEIQKSYLAGYIDGEGCIGYYSMPIILLESCHPAPMTFMQSIYGGRVRSRKRTGDRQTKRTVYVLRYGADLCIHILKELIPYLIEKKEQAEAIVRMRELKKVVTDSKRKDHIDTRQKKSPLAK